jgi:hypothetical protein
MASSYTGAASVKVVTPNVGEAATQAAMQPLAAGWQGAPSQSGQWVHGSSTADRSAAGIADDAHAHATTGTAVVRTARQASKAGRMRMHLMAP